MAEVAKVDGYAVEPPAGEWSYVIDGSPVIYRRGLVAQRLRRGWWPFAYVGSEREQRERHGDRREPGRVAQECGVAIMRLSPDTRNYAWRNEYVIIGPDRKVPHLAHASVTLWAGGRLTLPCHIHLDLQAGTYAVEGLPDDAPAGVRAHADLKGARLVAFLATACAERDASTDRQPATTAGLEEERERARHEKIRAYCAEHGMTYAPVEGWAEYAVINGERLPLYQVAARYLPDLFAG